MQWCFTLSATWWCHTDTHSQANVHTERAGENWPTFHHFNVPGCWLHVSENAAISWNPFCSPPLLTADRVKRSRSKNKSAASVCLSLTLHFQLVNESLLSYIPPLLSVSSPFFTCPLFITLIQLPSSSSPPLSPSPCFTSSPPPALICSVSLPLIYNYVLFNSYITQSSLHPFSATHLWPLISTSFSLSLLLPLLYSPTVPGYGKTSLLPWKLLK